MTSSGEKLRNAVLIMHCREGWYPIEDHSERTPEEKARVHGMLNGHVQWIEDMDGNVLWRKPVSN